MNTAASEDLLPTSVARVGASVVGIVTRRQRSAGVVWRDGVVVGSASAVWRHATVRLVMPDGEPVEGRVRGVDASTDLAVLQVDGASLPVADRAPAPGIRPGDVVFAVGREPSGLLEASFGHIGQVGGEWRSWRGGRVERRIRLDGGLYPGLSGAPVALREGTVIGVASGALSRHHGVVLPVETVDRVVEQLLAHGRVRRGYLGIAVQPARTAVDGEAVDGVLIGSLAEDGPAARAGLLVGDVIVRVANDPVTSPEALRDRLQPDAQVTLSLVRGGQALAVAVDVQQRPAARCG